MAYTVDAITTGSLNPITGVVGTGIVKGENIRSWLVTTDAFDAEVPVSIPIGSWVPDWAVITPWGANATAQNAWIDGYTIVGVTQPTIVNGAVTVPSSVQLNRFAAVGAATFRLTVGKNID